MLRVHCRIHEAQLAEESKAALAHRYDFWGLRPCRIDRIAEEKWAHHHMDAVYIIIVLLQLPRGLLRQRLALASLDSNFGFGVGVGGHRVPVEPC